MENTVERKPTTNIKTIYSLKGIRDITILAGSYIRGIEVIKDLECGTSMYTMRHPNRSPICITLLLSDGLNLNARGEGEAGAAQSMLWEIRIHCLHDRTLLDGELGKYVRLKGDPDEPYRDIP